ncbi:MAG: D-aminoacyl-tRNA deacylase [Wenzhouxiangellaceae bacterium]
MIGLIQRTISASVAIDGERVAETGAGMLVLVGFKHDDSEQRLDRFVERLLNYRIFPDDAGRMNRSLRDCGGDLLIVPQFTLAADTNAGNRPSFTPAAAPDQGRKFFEALQERMELAWPKSAYGVFGADMQVALVNDGPVTFWIEVV